MKIKNFSVLRCIALFGLSFLVGCAATPSDRSTGEVVDDASISTRVKSALLADKETDGMDIEVDVQRGRVQLIGFADSDAERRRAEEIARGIAGVTSVSNGLEIAKGDRRVGEYIDDKVLVTKVNTALAREPGVKSLAIEVEVNRGTVVLGGFVDTLEEKRKAGAAAGRVEGLKNVVNNIEVR